MDSNNQPILIENNMSASEILEHIRKRVKDVTELLDLRECDKIPMENGAFGDVYYGKLLDGTKVALKCLKLEVNQSAEGRQFVESFANELYVWSKCEHPNVIELIGMAQYRDQCAMVSPWMDNGNLMQYLRGRSHSSGERLRLCAQVAGAVAYLHINKIVCALGRGMLPEDLNVTAFIRFTEISKQFWMFNREGALPCVQKFQFGEQWDSPLDVADNGKPSYQADIHSAGMTIFEIMSGHIPYADTNEAGALRRIIGGIVPERPTEHIPSGNQQADALWTLLTEKCWAFEPKDRVSADELHQQIQAIAK